MPELPSQDCPPYVSQVLMNHLKEETLQTFWPEGITSVIKKAPVYVGEMLVTHIVRGTFCGVLTHNRCSVKTQLMLPMNTFVPSTTPILLV